MNSVIDLWKTPSSMSTILDMTFAIICGVGLYYLLIPFLIECPESPPPRREKKFPKVRNALVHTLWREADFSS